MSSNTIALVCRCGGEIEVTFDSDAWQTKVQATQDRLFAQLETWRVDHANCPYAPDPEATTSV